MPDAPHPPQDAPRRHGQEFEDNHFHDDDEVAQPPADEDVPLARPRVPTARRGRQLPPPKRRFYEE